MMAFIFLFIILFIIFLVLFKTNEYFVGYNVDQDNIPLFDKVDSEYNVQNITMQSLLNSANKTNPNYDNMDIDSLPIQGNADTSGASGIYNAKQILDKTGYELYNKNIDFPLENIFKDTILNYLIDNKIFNKDENIYIAGKLQNIYIKDF